MRHETTFQRLYIDIKDLVLSAVPELQGKRSIVVSKHLCGAATDVTLRCFTQTSPAPQPRPPCPPCPPCDAEAAAMPTPDNVREGGSTSDAHCEADGSTSSSPASAAAGDVRVEGAVIALCCHHVCNWNSYVGREFFTDNGISWQDFAYLCSLTSWAVCGQRSDAKAQVRVQSASAVRWWVGVGAVDSLGHDRITLTR